MRIWLIRHGKTFGNTEKRYIGTTDEPLLPEEIPALEALRTKLPEKPDLLISSPLLRCRQTAEALYPGRESVSVPDLRECDFGSFEKKNYKELSGDPAYQAWIDSGGLAPFPGGESVEEFEERCCRGFRAVLGEGERLRAGTIVFCVHGGTIMSILHRCAEEKRAYHDWLTENGEGFCAELLTDASAPVLRIIERIRRGNTNGS